MNGEKYQDPTADRAVHDAMRGRATPDMLLTIRLMRYLAEVCGFEVVGSIRLKRKETGRDRRTNS